MGIVARAQSSAAVQRSERRLRSLTARKGIPAVLMGCFLIVSSVGACAQAAVELPDVKIEAPAAAAHFRFVSDGPLGSGWDRNDRIARFYVHEWLPAFFSRTLVLNQEIPRRTTLSWIFTGPRAGFTVQVDAQDIRVFQRFYDSYGLFGSAQPQQGYPEKVVSDAVIPYRGHLHSITVALDAHMSLQVWANGKKLIEQQCLFDVQRQQMEYAAPRSEHDVVDGALLPEQTVITNVAVNPMKTHQTVLGFGGSPSIPAYAMLSDAGKKKFWEILRSYNLLVDREYPMGTRLKQDMSNLDDLDEASPHYYGDNFPNGEVSSFDYNRHIQDLGGSVIYEMWDLPSWAAEQQGKGSARKHAIANPEAYARAMVTYCQKEKERTGKAPAIVGVQNEVEQPESVALEMVRVLRKRLNEAGFASVKIHMADAPFTWQGVQRVAELKKDPEVWRSIDYAAVHEYDYQDFFTDPDMFDQYLAAMRQAIGDKPFLATEICINKPSLQTGSYRVAFNVGQLYHKNMTELDAIELLYCWVILDVEQPNFGASRSLLIPDRANGMMPIASSDELRVLGAFSRHIHEGMQRVDADSSNPDVLASAYRDSDGQATVILLNRSNAQQHIHLQWDGIKWRELERTSPYLQNEVSQVPKDIVIEPGEIVALSTLQAGPAIH